MATNNEENNENDVTKIAMALTTKYGHESLDDNEFKHAERIKYAISIMLDYPHKLREDHVRMLVDMFDISRSNAYKLITDAQEIFPSLEKVNREFERHRIIHIIYKMLNACKEKNNMRDGASLLKLLVTITGVDKEEEEGLVNRQPIINVFQTAPETLGIDMPENFDLNSFIKQVEKRYTQRKEEEAHD